MSSFGTYLIGFIVLIVGLGAAAFMAGAPPVWIAIGAIILIGIGVISATSRTKQKDPPGM